MNRLRLRELVRKEFIQLFRDKKNRPLLIIAPFVQLLVFGYVVTTDVRDIRVAVFDQARTRESRMLMDAVSANRTFRITHYPAHHDALDDILLNRRVDIAVKIPPDFSKRIREGHSSPVRHGESRRRSERLRRLAGIGCKVEYRTGTLRILSG